MMKRLCVFLVVISSLSNFSCDDNDTDANEFEQIPKYRRDSIYLKLQELYSKQSYTEAEQVINKLKPESNIDLYYYSFKAKIEYNCQKFTEAIFAVNSALKINPRSSTLNFLKSSCYFSINFPDSSLIYMNKAIDMDSTNAGYLMARSRIYEQMKIPVLQLDDINRVIRLDTNNLGYKQNLYLFKYNHGDTIGAKEGYESILKKNPNDFVSLKSLGFIYWRVSDFKTAKKYLQRCIDLNPTDGTVFFGMASILSSENNFEKSCDCLLKAVELDDEEAMKHIYKCEDYLKKKGILLQRREENGPTPSDNNTNNNNNASNI